MYTLYTYFRSSAAFRVRIALNLKRLDYQSIPVHLLRDGGQQHAAQFAARNPSRLVPVLDVDGTNLQQSLAIIEYLEETHPEPALMPNDPVQRAQVRGLALSIACDIHPLNNTRVVRYLSSTLGVDEAARNEWMRHWIDLGFQALEARLATSAPNGAFCFGPAPGLAECFLVPQAFNARRVGLSLSTYPRIDHIVERCMALDAFKRAAPEAQPDAEA